MSLNRQTPDANDITRLLLAVRVGGRPERDALFALVYDRLKHLARARLRRSPGSSLETTGLVHEAYLRFVDATRLEWHDRQHFFAAAAKAMRHIIVDDSRRRLAAKRGGGMEDAELNDRAASTASVDDVIAIDEALARLGDTSPRLVQVVELHFFAGLSIEETADAIGLSSRTVKREWQKAKLLLQALLRLPPAAGSS